MRDSAKIVTQEQLIQLVADANSSSSHKRFNFILGAGASIESGIPGAETLTKQWLGELDNPLPKWQNNPSQFYTEIFQKRFELDYKTGYIALQKAMKDAKPSIGYSFLSQILTKTKNKFVITTNFDTMTEDALFETDQARPLVVGHESLARFINANNPPRPTIIKLHRDLLLDPYNTQEDTKTIDKAWQAPLSDILSENATIVLGYAGNDNSLMGHLTNETADREPIYWCCRNPDTISEKIKKLLRSTDFLIKIESFDQFMLLLADKLEIESMIDKEDINQSQLVQNAIKRAKRYETQLQDLDKQADSAQETKAITKLLPSWWKYQLKVNKEQDSDIQNAIYLEGMKAYPNSHELMGNYAVFLERTRKDYDKAEKHYKKALELDPNSHVLMGNYASFLRVIREDYDQAEEYYKKALTLDPNSINNNGNYAIFLTDIRKDYDKAEKYYKKALTLEPNSANTNGNYAIFLKVIRKDYDKAEDYYKKALTLDSNSANTNGNYANFLTVIRKDYDQADKYYKKALTLEPNSANTNGNYASFLLIQGKQKLADKYLAQAFENQEADDLLLELWFYRLAHYPEHRQQACEELDNLLSQGHQSIGWGFSANIKQAVKSGFSPKSLLEEYARKITQVKPK